jgi:dihydroxy-acid dehydratase
MINGYLKGERAGSGMVVWKGRELFAAGEMNFDEFVDYVSKGYGDLCIAGLQGVG